MSGRPRGVDVEVLDLTGLLKAATETAHAGDLIASDQRAVTFAAPYGLMMGRDELTWLVCHEGVAYPIDGSVTVPLYTETVSEAGKVTSFGVFPSLEVHWRLDELEAARTGEVVDLADFVRTFGDRLEQNMRELYALGAGAL